MDPKKIIRVNNLLNELDHILFLQEYKEYYYFKNSLDSLFNAINKDSTIINGIPSPPHLATPPISQGQTPIGTPSVSQGQTPRETPPISQLQSPIETPPIVPSPPQLRTPPNENQLEDQG
jgi:hypothetical protein